MAGPSIADQSIETINKDNEKLATLLANPNTADETPAEKKADAKAATDEKALQAQIQAVQQSPWNQLSQGLVNQYKAAETPVAAAVSGTASPTVQEGAANSALASLGLSSSSPAGSWLAAQTQAAQQTAAPVSQAMAQEGAQYQAQEKPIENALAAGGEANALAVETAPQASWLQALASHIQSNLSIYGEVPTAALSTLSPGVLQALKQSGGYGGTAGAGITPIQNVHPAPSGGGSKANAPSSASQILSGAGSIGSVPAPSPAPG